MNDNHDDLLKALEDVGGFTPEELEKVKQSFGVTEKDLEKGGDNDIDPEKNSNKEYDDLKKSYSELQEACGILKKSLTDKESELIKMKEKMDSLNKSENDDLNKGGDGSEKELEDLDKSEKDDLIKSQIQSTILEAIKPFKELVEASQEKIDVLQKSVDSISSISQGKKAITSQDLLLKAGEDVTDESGKIVLDIAKDRNRVIQAMEDSLEKAENDNDQPLIKALNDGIFDLNAGHKVPSAVVAKNLFDNHNIRLVKNK
jgi:hypothetical protein